MSIEYFEYMDTMMTEVRDWDETHPEDDTCDEAEWEELYEDPDYEMGFDPCNWSYSEVSGGPCLEDWYPEDEMDLDMGFDPYLGCYTDDC